MKWVLLAASHAIVAALGFAAGIYVLPILTAPSGPSIAEVASVAGRAQYTARFRRDLKGSDPLHWGEGAVTVGERAVSFEGKLAPGPDYKLYLSPQYVETKDDFLRVKERAIRVGDVKTFSTFIVTIPESVDVSRYDTVIVWCERFSMFITAAKYRA